MGNNSNTIYDIIILGAGVSGIGMAHSLLKAKNQTFINIYLTYTNFKSKNIMGG